MKKKLSSILAFLFIVGDLFFLNLAIFLSYKLLSIQFLDNELANSVYLFTFSNLAWFYLLLITNPYGVSSATQLTILIRSHFSFVFVHLLVLLSLVFFFDKTYEARQIICVYSFFIPVVFSWRVLYFYLIKIVVKGTMTNMRYIIIGAGELAQKLRRDFRFHPEYGYKFLGYFDQHTRAHDVKSFRDVQVFCLEAGVNEIYCCWPDISSMELKGLIDFGLNHFIKVKLVTDTSEYSQKGIQLERFGKIPVLNVAAIPLDDSRNQVIKRIFDICFTAIISVTILIWLIPLIAVMIKLDSEGPVLFKQLRAGKSNKPFNCLKFRTMILDEKADFVQAKQNDPRITRVGKFLRKTSLDEFPQFMNVLMGDMSIVGPRPHPIKLNDDFSSKIRKLMSRHYVKPGITGLAQCMGYRGETKSFLEMKNRITLDRFYVENWTMFFDIKIILQTAISLIRGSEKAY